MKDKLEQLKKHIDFCCIQAQKSIGSGDFNIWEKRREETEREIDKLLKENNHV